MYPLTILIPTRNRPEFLMRLLDYYQRVECPYEISIGDSSNDTDTIERYLSNVKKLDIRYEKYPELNEPACTLELAKKSKMRYVAFLPDDDFIIPNGLGECISFLESTQIYSVVIGVGVSLVLYQKGVYGEARATSEYNLKSNEDQNILQRFKFSFENYCNTNFGVHRREQFISASDNLNDPIYNEIGINIASAIEGKVKKIDTLYLVRHLHENRFPSMTGFNWMAQSFWGENYKKMCNNLVEALIKKGVFKHEAERCVVQYFFHYLHNNISKAEKLRKKEINKNVFLSGMAQNIRNILPKGEFSLPSLLSKNSKYYEDFIKVHDVIKRC